VSGAAQGAEALDWNPAGLGEVNEKTLSVMYGMYLESVSDQHVSYAQPAGKWGTAALSAHMLSYGRIEMTDETGISAGGYSPRESVYSVGLGRPLGKKFFVGGTAEWIQSKIVHSDSTLALSAGAKFVAGRWSAAAALSHWGQGLKLDKETSPLPQSMRLDGAYRWTEKTSFYLGAEQLRGSGMSEGFGVEHIVPLTKIGSFAIRGGYNSRSTDLSGFSGYRLGLGFQRGILRMDYVWMPMGDLGNTQRFSMAINFGNAPAPKQVEAVPPPPAPIIEPPPPAPIVPASPPAVVEPAPTPVPQKVSPPKAIEPERKKPLLPARLRGDGEGLYYKAMRQYAEDDINGAIETLEKAREIDPDDNDVNEALKRLKREFEGGTPK
jgi:hypothetical protein